MTTMTTEEKMSFIPRLRACLWRVRYRRRAARRRRAALAEYRAAKVRGIREDQAGKVREYTL